MLLQESRESWQRAFFLLRESGSVSELRRMTVLEYFALVKIKKEFNEELKALYDGKNKH